VVRDVLQVVDLIGVFGLRASSHPLRQTTKPARSPHLAGFVLLACPLLLPWRWPAKLIYPPVACAPLRVVVFGRLQVQLGFPSGLQLLKAHEQLSRGEAIGRQADTALELPQRRARGGAHLAIGFAAVEAALVQG